jgi:putative two-component system response regulator
MGSTYTDGLEVLLRSQDKGASPNLKIELTRLSLSIKERLLRSRPTSLDFFTSALQVLIALKGSSNAELRLKCLYGCCQFFYTAGFPHPALDSARALESLARKTQSTQWRRTARNLCGITNSDVGNIPEAIVCYADAICLARDLKDVNAERAALVNLGSALLYSGLSEEAARCFECVAALADVRQVSDYVAYNALINLAQVHLYNENYGEGMDALSEAMRLADEPTNADAALNRTIFEYTYVLLALGLNEIELARHHLQGCVRYSRWGESRRSGFLASIAQSLFDVFAGDVAKGLSSLDKALVANKEISHSRLTCLTTLVKALDAAGRPEEALKYASELVGVVRSLQESAVKAVGQVGSTIVRANGKGAGRLVTLERRQLKLRTEAAEHEVVRLRLEMLDRLAITADFREEPSGEHGYRVGKLSRLVAEHMSWRQDDCDALEQAGRLHDIGKVGVPERILLSADKLGEEDRPFVAAHTQIGSELLAKSNVPQLRLAEEVAHYHHERWDGSGYPDGLKGKQIPLPARIVAIADVFDALTHVHSYAAPRSVNRALDEIKRLRGSHFDPDQADAFLDLVKRLNAEHDDLDAFLARESRNSSFMEACRKIRILVSGGSARQAWKSSCAGDASQ